MQDLETDIDTVLVKDFSRLGRHNARVLLLLDEFQERGKQLIVIDDHYDSLQSDDDTIGITTWFNERYVKDTSKKIKHALKARQKEGTLLTQPPFGYRRNQTEKNILEIIPNEAAFVKQIYDLYISGSGYRKIANYLTEQNIPTPSMARREHELAKGQVTKRSVAYRWTDTMVKELLDNDFYTGTLRLRKRVRNTVHGKDQRVPKAQQFIFPNHHPAIIDNTTFHLVQNIKQKRNHSHYRGSRGQWNSSQIPNPFGSCLYCKDCGCRLTPIKRKTSNKERKYYICTTYNTKGKQYCPKAHLIEENDLLEDLLIYLKLCRNTLFETIADLSLKDLKAETKSPIPSKQELQDAITEKKEQLKILLRQRLKDLSTISSDKSDLNKTTFHETITNEDIVNQTIASENIINETYHSLQQEILSDLQRLDIQLKTFDPTDSEIINNKNQANTVNALEVMDRIIANRIPDRRDIELLIERIDVDAEGCPQIQLKYSLSHLLSDSPSKQINAKENAIIESIIKLIIDTPTKFISTSNIMEQLKKSGYEKTTKDILPYIELMKEWGILSFNDDPLKSYKIIKPRKEIELIHASFFT